MTLKNKIALVCLAGGLMLAGPVFAQQVATFRAQIRGGGDHGKCTIEVDVDGVAEIEIQGDQGRMRTLSGNPAGWRRMECNEPLPPNPPGFRFSGVDGRGRQTLLRDPSSNRGVAVVRIEDPQGGHEGYTFDIEWGGVFARSEAAASIAVMAAGLIAAVTAGLIEIETEIAMATGTATATAAGTMKSVSRDAATAISITSADPIAGSTIARFRWIAAVRSRLRLRPTAAHD